MQKNWGDKVKLGEYQLKNRIFMAAMTRQRCDPLTGIPTDLMVDYYAQRSGAGLILTECVAWNQRGQAFPGAANLYNNQHKDGWRKVVDAVHKKGGLIYVQIFHGGRSCMKDTTRGLQPWAPSAVQIRDLNFFEQKPYDTPHAMTLQEIQQTKNDFRNSVKLAKQAGFDGIQLHGAHGYLVDNFLRSWTNQRTDKYGGCAQNRCRFAVQLIDIALEVFKPYQVGIKVSPVSRFGDNYDENPAETYTKLAQLLQERKIGFIQARQSNQPVSSKQQFPKLPLQQVPDVCKLLRSHFSGHLIPNQQLTQITGLQKIRSGICELVSFGRLYIPNPDLAERIIAGQQLDRSQDWYTYFRGMNKQNLGAKGYTDYPCYQQWSKINKQ